MAAGRSEMTVGDIPARQSVSAAAAGHFLAFAVSAGAARDAVLSEAKLTEADLADPEARVPLDRYLALIRAANRATADPALPLHFGTAIDMAEFSLVGLIFRACETISESIEQVNRYGRLALDVTIDGPVRFDLSERGGRLWMIDRRVGAAETFELTEITFARFIAMTESVAPGLVMEVQLAWPRPVHDDAYRAVLGVPARFAGESNAMRLDPGLLNAPIRHQPRYVFGLLCNSADADLARLAAGASFAARVEAALLPALHTGQADIARVAKQLGISRQTVHRRLKGEGLTFSALLDRLRERLARDYLEGGKVTVNETAYLVGYSDPAAFSRAFKRWTGVRPGAFRARG